MSHFENLIEKICLPQNLEFAVWNYFEYLQVKFIEITLWNGHSLVNLMHIFRTPFHNRIKHRGHEQHFSSTRSKKYCTAHGCKMLHVTHQLNTAANPIFAAKKCCKNTAAKLNQSDFAAVFLHHFFCFLTIKHTFETWFPLGPRVQQIFVENFVYYITKCLRKKNTTS